MSPEVCEVVVTAPSHDWLAMFARGLVEDRLAACGHIINEIRSIYRWQNMVHDEIEARVALHTRRSNVPAIIDRVNRDHPYEVPCVVTLPIVAGNPSYLDWILRETTDAIAPAK